MIGLGLPDQGRVCSSPARPSAGAPRVLCCHWAASPGRAHRGRACTTTSAEPRPSPRPSPKKNTCFRNTGYRGTGPGKSQDELDWRWQSGMEVVSTLAMRWNANTRRFDFQRLLTLPSTTPRRRGGTNARAWVAMGVHVGEGEGAPLGWDAVWPACCESQSSYEATTGGSCSRSTTMRDTCCPPSRRSCRPARCSRVRPPAAMPERLS